MERKLYQAIARTIMARQNCIKSGNVEWKDRHEETLNKLADELPSGSGIDSGSAIDWNKSSADKLVIHAPFHHMDEHGGYDGWTDHTIIVRPSLAFGIDIRITGRDRNGIKEYLTETFNFALDSMVNI